MTTLQHRFTDPVAVGQLRFGNGPELDGTFEGYLSVHGVTDSYGTRMMPGCWRAGGLDDKPYALLWMHDPTQVIGTFTATEDERGLLISGRFDATDEGQRARARAQSGSAPGLSVGFNPRQSLPDDPDAFTVCELIEGSLITARMASTPGASVTGVRAAAQADPIVQPPVEVVDLDAERQARRRQRLAAGLRLRSTSVEIITPPPVK